MHFKFNINLNDTDYYDYNVFWMIKSPYGKKQMLKFRVMIAIIFGAGCLLSLFGGGFTVGAWIGVIPYIVLLVLAELLWNSFFIWTLRGYLKSLKKKGKMGYSPVSEIEFYDESFVETTSENKTEQKYTAIERVSIITDKVVYIHVNNVMSYIFPLNCFESKEQYGDFLAFIKTKCDNIDIY